MERSIVRTILIEDSDTFAQALMDALQDAKCYEYHVKRMPIASACILLGRPMNRVDLVLLDLNLPPNFEAADAVVLIRATNKSVPIIVITGDGSYQTAFAAGKAGALAYICKVGHTMENIKNLIRDAYAAMPAGVACAPVVEQIAAANAVLAAGELSPNLPPWTEFDDVSDIPSHDFGKGDTKMDARPVRLPPKK